VLGEWFAYRLSKAVSGRCGAGALHPSPETELTFLQALWKASLKLNSNKDWNVSAEPFKQ